VELPPLPPDFKDDLPRSRACGGVALAPTAWVAQVVLSIAVEILVSRKVISPANPFLPILRLGFHRNEAGHWRPTFGISY
jgi:hypothetical protein